MIASLFDPTLEYSNELHLLLVAILQVPPEWIWHLDYVDCLGAEMERLHCLSDEAIIISTNDFLPILDGVHQIIEGDFEAYDPVTVELLLSIIISDGLYCSIEYDEDKLSRYQYRIEGLASEAYND